MNSSLDCSLWSQSRDSRWSLSTHQPSSAGSISSSSLLVWRSTSSSSSSHLSTATFSSMISPKRLSTAMWPAGGGPSASQSLSHSFGPIVVAAQSLNKIMYGRTRQACLFRAEREGSWKTQNSSLSADDREPHGDDSATKNIAHHEPLEALAFARAARRLAESGAPSVRR